MQLKLHNVVDFLYASSYVERCLKDFKFVVFESCEIKSVLDHVLQMDGAVVSDLEVLQDLNEV